MWVTATGCCAVGTRRWGLFGQVAGLTVYLSADGDLVFEERDTAAMMSQSVIFPDRMQKKALSWIAAVCVAASLLTISVAWWTGHTASGSAVAAVNYPREVARVTFAAAGDVIPHQAVVQAAVAQAKVLAQETKEAKEANDGKEAKEAKETAGGSTSVPASGATTKAAAPPSGENPHAGWDSLFAGVSEVFRQADFAFVNLETPVAPKHSRGTKAFMFNAPMALVESLKSNNVKIVSFANNHVFDQGHAGFGESLEHLQEEGFLFAGAGSSADDAWKPRIAEKNGIKVGWLGMTRWLNGNRNPEKDSDPHVAFFPYPGQAMGAPGRDEAGVLEAVKAAREACDLLVISIHWGAEYSVAPSPQDEELAHKMLEAGASAIIGHHPHVLQAVETYVTEDGRNTVIFYSLGNFLSNQARNYVSGFTPDRTGEQRDSLMVKFAVVKKDYGPAGMRVELADVGILPVWTENNNLQVKARKAKTPFIGPVFIDREIARLQGQYDELDKIGDQLTADQKKEFVQVSKRLEMFKHRRELLLGRTGDDFLIAPPEDRK